jgi:hypothetical protein
MIECTTGQMTGMDKTRFAESAVECVWRTLSFVNNILNYDNSRLIKKLLK